MVAAEDADVLGAISRGKGKPIVGEVTSGEDMEGEISCLSAGNGNNFESWYLSRSAEEGGGMGEEPPAGADWGAKEIADADAEVDCMSGG